MNHDTLSTIMTSSHMQLVSGKDFCDFAVGNLTYWSQIENHEVVHLERGQGRITCVEQRSNYIPLIYIRFENGSVKFNSDAFRKGLLSIYVPASLAQEIENQLKVKAIIETERLKRKAVITKEREEIERRKMELFERLGPLVKKYNVHHDYLWEDGAISPLCGILEKLEANEQPEQWMTEWVECKKLYRLAATIHYRNFKHADDNWSLVKSCKYLRKANLPEKVITIAKECNSGDKKIRGALFTTLGGAFRDLGQLTKAKESALEAIQQSPTSFHPHNLMGAILYESGFPEKGDEHFGIAEQFGSNAQNKDHEIQIALRKSAPEARRIVIRYLLQKNEVKYSWVKKYA